MKNNITTFNLILSTPKLEDYSALHDFENQNKNHLAKWESSQNSKECEQRLENWGRECDEGKSTRFFIRTKENPDIIIGLCNFTQIFRGAFLACYLGYKIDHAYEGKGFMFEALQALIRYVFEELGLHRIMANYMPSNIRSANLLHRLGFVIEGYAKNYLLINDHWADHVLTALSLEQWQSNNSHGKSTKLITTHKDVK